MPKTVSDYLSCVKRSCDNNTLMYCFKDSMARAYNRSVLFSVWKSRIYSISYRNQKNDLSNGDHAYDDSDSTVVDGAYPVYKYVVNSNGSIAWVKTPWYTEKVTENINGVDETYYVYSDTGNTYYNKKVMNRFQWEQCPNIFYKNSKGVWIDYNKCVRSYPGIDIDVASITWEDRLKITDLSVLPRCIFVDADRYTYFIDAKDGNVEGSVLASSEIDINNASEVQYEPCKIGDNTIPFSARHVMTDLKITLSQNKSKDNYLTWLNGAFVPTIQDSSYKNIMYIENAMTMIGTKVISQVPGSPHEITSNGTIIEDHKYDQYRYDVNLRFFGWKGVKVSDFNKPINTGKVAIGHNFSYIYPSKTVTFGVDINEDAHFIICNGRILEKSEYTISEDKRTITLLNVEREAYKLLNEIISDINDNLEYYANVNPLKLLGRVILQKTFSLVNFSSEDTTKHLYLRSSTACAVNFPYKNEITFAEMNIGDLILIKGMYVPHEIIHMNTIKIPRTAYSFDETLENGWEEADYMREEDVQRYFFELV